LPKPFNHLRPLNETNQNTAATIPLRPGRPIAQVSESWFTMTDTYRVDITAGQEDVLILACTVVIERCQGQSQHRHRMQATIITPYPSLV
jgi:hypothetical protein